MLTSLKVTNFKNFRDEQHLIIFDPGEDACALSILIGKNGAGKSSTFDAIEWVVFNRSPKTLRAWKQDDLISDGKDFASVEAEFVQRNGKMSLKITRELRKGFQPQSHARLYGKDDNSSIAVDRKLQKAEDIAVALRQYFNIDISNLERIFIKQRSVSSMSCAKPKTLLASLEIFIGTDKINTSANKCLIDRDRISLEKQNILIASDQVLFSIKGIQPDVNIAMELQSQRLDLNNCLLKLHTAEHQELKNEEKRLSIHLKSKTNSYSLISEKVSAMGSKIDALNKRLRDLRTEERKKLRELEKCNETQHETEDKIEKMIAYRKRRVQTSNNRGKQIKDIVKLIGGQKECIESLEKLRRELKEDFVVQGNEARSVKEEIYCLLCPPKLQNGDIPNLVIDKFEVTQDLDTKVRDIMKILDKMEELKLILGNMEEWKSNIENIVLKTSDRRKNIEKDRLKFEELEVRNSHESKEISKLKAEIDILDREERRSEEAILLLRDKYSNINRSVSLLRRGNDNAKQRKDVITRLQSFSRLSSHLQHEGGPNHKIIGVLCDLVGPLAPSHLIAGTSVDAVTLNRIVSDIFFPISKIALAVFGESLTKAIVVSTRSTAVIIAQACKKLNVDRVTIDILEEIQIPSDFRKSKAPTQSGLNTHHDNHNYKAKETTVVGGTVIRPQKDLVLMIECVSIPNSLVRPAINLRLKNWFYFDGAGYQALQYVTMHFMAEKYKKGHGMGFNIVATDGSRIMRDGEIRTQTAASLSMSQSSGKNIVSEHQWPSSLGLGIGLSGDEKSSESFCKEHIDALQVSLFKVKSQISLAVLHHDEVSAQNGAKKTFLSDFISLNEANRSDTLSELSEGKIMKNIGDLRINLADIMISLLADEDRIKNDTENLDRSFVEVADSQESLRLKLSSLLVSSPSLQDKINKEYLLSKFHDQRKLVDEIAQIESKERITKLEIVALKLSVTVQEEKLTALDDSLSQDIDSEKGGSIIVARKKLSRGNDISKLAIANQKKRTIRESIEAKEYLLEMKRYEEGLLMVDEDARGKEHQTNIITAGIRDNMFQKSMAITELDQFKKRSRISFELIQKAKSELASVRNAVDAKTVLINEVWEKLQLPVAMLPEFDIGAFDERNCDELVDNENMYHSQEVRLPSSTSSVLHSAASDTGDAESIHVRGDSEEQTVNSNQILSDSDFDTPSLKEKVARFQDKDGNRISHQELASNHDVAIRVKNLKKKKKSHHHSGSGKVSMNVSMSDENESNSRNEEIIHKKEVAAINKDLAATLPQLDLWADQLALRTKNISQREREIDFYAITSKYTELVLQYRAMSMDARDLNKRALEVQRKSNQLQEERFAVLMHYLRLISSKLSETYRRIAPGADCYLSYASNPISLFKEGATLLAQHGQSSWQEANNLSGGQQAACSLALILSIQDSFPSPLYIMDEIDASLDTSTVARVGALIREKSLVSGVQFLLISHRPEMQEHASRLVGLYMCDEMPRVISVGFHAIDEICPNDKEA